MDFNKFPTGKAIYLPTFSNEQKVNWPEDLGIRLKNWMILLMQSKADELGITDDNLDFMYMFKLKSAETLEDNYGVIARWRKDPDKPITVKMPFDLVKTAISWKLTIEEYFPPA
jgi:hypothetical protein